MIRIQHKTRTSNPLSKLFRKVFEKKNIKAAFGGFISITTLASGMFVLPSDQSALASTNIQPFVENVVIETQKSLSNVIPENTGISQGFHIGHPGMDITASLGSKIYPLKAGKVVLLSYSKWDYGRSVIVDHGNGLKTRYAHMGKVYVQEGEDLTTEKVIGEVGLTGRTTGPHLHIEVYKNDKPVNPASYLTITKTRLASRSN